MTTVSIDCCAPCEKREQTCCCAGEGIKRQPASLGDGIAEFLRIATGSDSLVLDRVILR